jgi:hypothetical protein
MDSAAKRFERVYFRALLTLLTVLGAISNAALPIWMGWLAAERGGPLVGAAVGLVVALIMWPAAYFLIKYWGNAWRLGA